MIQSYKDLIGLTVMEINREEDAMTFVMNNGRTVRFYHDQDCCESVAINSIDGTLESLIGFPLTNVQEYIGDEEAPAGWVDNSIASYNDSHTWTRYEFETANGIVSVRWFGTSNGYYSESVNFADITG